MSLATFSKFINKIRPGHMQASNLAYGANDAMLLDIYGIKSKSLKPVIVFWHGGSWTNGNKDYYRFIADYLESLGAIVVIVGHPLSPGQTFPGFINDAHKAIDWIQKNITQYGGDPKRIYTMGHSSGAHIAAIATMQDTKNKIQGCIALATPSTISKTYYKNIFGTAFAGNKHQPASYVNCSKHRFLLIHGLTDRIVPYRDSLQFHNALLNAGNESELVTLKVMGHMRLLTTIVRPFAYRYIVGRKIRHFIQVV
jgi:acetyl esterase/lipase